MNIGALLVLGFCDDPVHKDYFMYYRKSRSHCIFLICKKYNVTGFPELHFEATPRSAGFCDDLIQTDYSMYYRKSRSNLSELTNSQPLAIS